jgi:hypothetical protein
MSTCSNLKDRRPVKKTLPRPAVPAYGQHQELALETGCKLLLPSFQKTRPYPLRGTMIRTFSRRLIAVLVSVECAYAVDTTQLLTPFSIRNQNPFIQIYGFPATEPAALLEAGKHSMDINVDYSNNSMLETSGSEEIALDGETYRLSLTLRTGTAHGVEYGIELPFIAHNVGFMDNFIEGWHDAFGMDNYERNKTFSNTLRYEYRRNGTTLLGFTEPNAGVGDLRFFAAKHLRSTSEDALSVHANLKLPTGSANHLHGSGGTDISLSLAYQKHRWLSPQKLTTFLNAGLLVLGDSDHFTQIQRRTVGFGSTGILWDANGSLDLKVQLDGHTSVYKSDLDQLGHDTIQLTVGGTAHFSSGARLDFGVGENLFIDATPDLHINVAYKQLF